MRVEARDHNRVFISEKNKTKNKKQKIVYN